MNSCSVCGHEIRVHKFASQATNEFNLSIPVEEALVDMASDKKADMDRAAKQGKEYWVWMNILIHVFVPTSVFVKHCTGFYLSTYQDPRLLPNMPALIPSAYVPFWTSEPTD